MRPVRCLLSSPFVTAAVLADQSPMSLVARHEQHCLRCQAHRASLRTTRRTLSGFGGVKEPPPVAIEQFVLGSIVQARPGAARPGERTWWPAAATAGVAFAALAAWGWRLLRSHGGRA